jgi:nitrous oxidase accessory protein NosD
MRRSIGVLTVVAVIAVCLTSASSALAAKTVCGSGCAYTSIQSAINAAAPGATITIGAGSYTENVVVNKSVTLEGSGPHTVIYPAVSNPVCSPGSLCEGAASTIVLVQADNVTITKLKLEGDNPSLTSGVIVGGKDIDARNGIITNHAIGTFNNLTVSKVVIADIYLRGVYASSGGSFNFNHDTVENVQGEGASIAMFNFDGTGVMSHNKVVSANDAISANWSKGTQFLDNKVSKSGSGIHTDNNGGSGGTADLISGNKISECSKDGYGIWVFAPYLSANVDSNKIKGCYIGIAAFGSQVSGEGPTFSGNTVDGTGATTSDPNGTYGAYLTTDLLGFAFGDLTATLSGNSFEHSGTGVLVTQTSPTEGQPAGGQATVTASNNTIHANTVGANGESGTVVNAENNWWGCKQGPNASPSCDTTTGTVSYTPWLTTKP